MPAERPLWLQILTAHAWGFAYVFLLSFLTTIGSFMPAYLVLKLVGMMEAGREDERHSPRAWLIVASIVAVMILNAFIYNIFMEYKWHRLTLSVYAQINALVFQKSLRCKDIKDAPKGVKSDGSTEEPKDDSENGQDGTNNNQINLVGYDSNRVAYFCSNWTYVIAEPLFNTIACFSFLCRLLGWRPVAVLSVVIVIICVVQFYVFKNYSRVEKSVMTARDTKLVTVTEAIRGIRHVKFAAAEDDWESKVLTDRNVELKKLWTFFMWDIGLWTMYSAISTLLTVALLVSYAYFEGALTPSVAFSSIVAINLYTSTVSLFAVSRS
jgi:ABC-type multidrug transport system fused ATPase/permease subunit